MINPQKIVNKILSDNISKSRVKLPNIKKEIVTAMGPAHYFGTEIEDKNGRWNDNYYIRDGFWVIHEGNHHHVYRSEING
jgi:hypothetical protein